MVVPEIVMVRIQNVRVQSFLTAAAINLEPAGPQFCERPPKARFAPDSPLEGDGFAAGHSRHEIPA
jgi:hypothetical protein